MRIQSGLIRWFRKWHKWVGLFLGVFIFISSLTGVLLAWKKQFHTLQPTEQKHGNRELAAYLPVSELVNLGNAYWQQQYPNEINGVARIDIKADKGIVKLLFEKGYWEAQINPVSGEILSLARRHSDWIEALHDGSLIGDNFKIVTMSVLGLGLCLMLVSGFYLWYGPKKIRQHKYQQK
jgi:uncharacterized iron-regulated membrane protein